MLLTSLHFPSACGLREQLLRFLSKILPKREQPATAPQLSSSPPSEHRVPVLHSEANDMEPRRASSRERGLSEWYDEGKVESARRES
jgi:hypothetical protein